MKKIEIVLIDHVNSSLIRTTNLLKKSSKVDITGIFNDAKLALEFIIETKPDLVISEIEMAGISGIKIAKEIKKQFLDTKVIFYSEHAHYAISAIKVSAFDYFLKPISIEELQHCIHRFQVSHQIDLNKRELQIIKKISEGLNSKSIGETLFISKHTVDKYRRNILEKTNCNNTEELVKYVTQVGII